MDSASAKTLAQVTERNPPPTHFATQTAPMRAHVTAVHNLATSWPSGPNQSIFGSFSPGPIRQANVGRAQTKGWNSP